MKNKLKYTLLGYLILTLQCTYARSNKDADLLFNWGEVLFPTLFSPTTTDSSIFDIYYFRFYSNTGLYLAVSDNDEVFLFDGQTLSLVGHVNDYLAGAKDFAGNNGQCVMIPAPVGKKIIYTQTVTDSTGTTSNEIKTEYLSALNDKEIIKETTENIINGEADFPIITTTTQENNYQIIGEQRALVSQNTTVNISVPGLLLDGKQVPDSTTSQTTTFTPNRLEGPFAKLCQGATWNTPEVEQSTVLDNKTTLSTLSALKGKIDIINTSKTVKAGTFNTVQIEINSADANDPEGNQILQWIDTQTGVTIQAETRSKNGVTVIREAIEIL